MVSADFSDALELLNWADGEINVLEGNLRRFAQTYPYTITSDRDADGLSRYYLEVTELNLRQFAPAVQSIIQSQRSSLDYLAVALAEANDAIEPSDVYFPIVRDEVALTERNTLKKIRRLDVVHQQAILALKPHGGPDGNPLLFALHQMNIQQKHRRLCAVGVVPHLTGFAVVKGLGSVHVARIDYAPPVVLSQGRHLIATAQVEGEMQLNVALTISFANVPGTQAQPEAIQLLRYFNVLCRAIIASFQP